MAELEQRLALLEEGMYFQEKLLKELDEALQAQQKHLDFLEKKLTLTEEKLAEALAQNSEGFEQGMPPHSVKL